jgi:hypothetical protein
VFRCSNSNYKNLVGKVASFSTIFRNIYIESITNNKKVILVICGGVNYAPDGSGLPNPSGNLEQPAKHETCFVPCKNFRFLRL